MVNLPLNSRGLVMAPSLLYESPALLFFVGDTDDNDDDDVADGDNVIFIPVCWCDVGDGVMELSF